MPRAVSSPIIMSFLFLSIAGYSRAEGIGRRADSAVLPCRQTAQALLDEALGFMQKNYYRRNAIQWDELMAAARARLNASSSCEDAYSAIGWCFSRISESHSFLMPPASAARYNDDSSVLSHAPSLGEMVGEIKGEWIQDSIGYLTIPWVSTTDSLVCMRIADSLQEIIARLDTRKISRWIIDLRQNTGGNCWPMLAGIGPLLGEGVCGYFVSDNERIPISYHDGAAFQGKHILCRVSHDGYRMQRQQKSIVVLTGHRTVSAGEIVALAFKGRQQVCLYGEPTAGLTTANATYSLSDHSMLVLTVCQEADHTGRVCSGSIFPDKYINQPYSTTALNDPVRTAAINWLQSQ
ncbi:MAG: S41 family peptidase [Bacteroidota bacterium]|nr:S41 family peptidase [Bacteroidota bacterium]MDP4218115.1 S41 family peptidase [Bacteroidota bacterium]MDP4255840.1 S41 family peptidase [Bacteroidota bacterium]MDP4259280.1 S41 family peptidase [Bacteroidota bacterium]